jgi:hypothetical protein
MSSLLAPAAVEIPIGEHTLRLTAADLPPKAEDIIDVLLKANVPLITWLDAALLYYSLLSVPASASAASTSPATACLAIIQRMLLPGM